MIKIGTCQYQLEKMLGWSDYFKKIDSLIKKAKKDNVDILLLPEYAGIECVCNSFKTEQELFDALQIIIPRYIDIFKYFAMKYNMYILPGTIIEKNSEGVFNNRAYIFSPNGEFGYQDKLQLTEYEKKTSVLQPGKEQAIFETSKGKIGIAVCYDSEFPEIVRNLVRNGATLILVPSYTNTISGYNRVFLSCRARAIENQCYVAIAYTVNEVGLSAEVESTFGQAAILSPVDAGFPEDGIIVQGKMNEVALITSEISFKKSMLVRKRGAVHNFEDSKKFPINMCCKKIIF